MPRDTIGHEGSRFSSGLRASLLDAAHSPHAQMPPGFSFGVALHMHDLSDKQYRVDLHVHTRRYSPCAELLDPDMLGRKMRERKLHGVVITEHDAIWSKQEIRQLSNGFEALRIYRGAEVTTSIGHLVVIGLDDLEGINSGVPFDIVIEKAKRCGAAVILVHHHLVYSNVRIPVDALALPDGIDAIEVASTITIDKKEQEAKRLAKMRGWSQVAGSDAHSIERVGETFTSFKELPADEMRLAEAIREGLGVPMRSPYRIKEKKHAG